LRSLTVRLAERLGITRALIYTVLGRSWSVLSGAISLIFVARFLTTDQQGFYFTFWSVLGLWVFFDLGLSVSIVQFASHERAALSLVDGRMVGDLRARQRLASLCRLALQWGAWAACLMFVIVMPAGLIFFGKYRPAGVHVNWILPWILVVLATTLNVIIGPLGAILEGSGLIEDTSLMRLLQTMAANLTLWTALALGAALYSAVLLAAMMAAFGLGWIFIRHRRFFNDLRHAPAGGERIHWRSEMWPFQWRSAMSWMTGYFTFQIFNPILFAAQGPAAAGKMGISVLVSATIGMFAQSWINTRAVDFGALVAGRRFDELDRVFRNTFVQSTGVVVFLSAGVLGGVELLRWFHHPMARRLLEPLPLAILLLATALNNIVIAEAAYLRAFKREPFVVIFLPVFILTTVGSLVVAHRFGAMGMATVLLAAVTVVGVGCGTVLFLARRRQWRDAGLSVSPPVVELPELPVI
jgi:hypothetical protein